MPLPTSYDESELAAFMVTELGPLGTDLGLDASALAPAVDDTLFAYFGDAGGAIADATDIRKLRALARGEAWQTAVTWTAADINSSTDGQSLSMAGRHAQAVARLADARNRATRYHADNQVLVTTLTYAVDPFAVLTDAPEF
jgi:hypothetical protein